MPTILHKAQETVDRNQVLYGHPDINHARIIGMINSLLGEEYLKKPLLPEHWSKFEILAKLSRSMEDYKEDHMLDVAGYALTHELIKERERLDAKLSKGFMESLPGVAPGHGLHVVSRDNGRPEHQVEHGVEHPGQDPQTVDRIHDCTQGACGRARTRKGIQPAQMEEVVDGDIPF